MSILFIRNIDACMIVSCACRGKLCLMYKYIFIYTIILKYIFKSLVYFLSVVSMIVQIKNNIQINNDITVLIFSSTCMQ